MQTVDDFRRDDTIHFPNSTMPQGFLQGMKKYTKKAHPVKALCQKEDFSVTVSWQKEPLKAKAGDYLLMDEDSCWPVAKDIFLESYKHLAGDMYIKTGHVLALAIDKAFLVQTLEGPAWGKPGDYLAQGVAGEIWPIPWAKFKTDYSLS